MLTNRTWFSDSPVLDTGDVDEVRSMLSAKGIRFDLARGSGVGSPMRARINARYQPSMYFGWMAYGASTVMDIRPARDVYAINIATGGSWESRVGRVDTTYGVGTASIGSPGREETVTTSHDCRRIQACIERDAVVRHLALVMDRPVHAAPQFLPSMDLATPQGTSLAQTFQFIARELENASGAVNPIVQQQLQDYLITRILTAVPHALQEAYASQCASPSPASVRRAVDFMHAYAHQPIGIEDIVTASGVSGRSLFRHFREWKGASPLEYLREIRFRRAREDLVSAEPKVTISEIADRWGFTNPGRFAREFKARFGEFPSQVRARHHAPLRRRSAPLLG